MMTLGTFNCELESLEIPYIILPLFLRHYKRGHCFCAGIRIGSPETYPRRDAA